MKITGVDLKGLVQGKDFHFSGIKKLLNRVCDPGGVVREWVGNRFRG